MELLAIKVFFSKCDQIRSSDLVTFTDKILTGKFRILCGIEETLSWHPNVSFDWFRTEYEKYIVKIFRENIASRCLSDKHRELKKVRSNLVILTSLHIGRDKVERVKIKTTI